MSTTLGRVVSPSTAAIGSGVARATLIVALVAGAVTGLAVGAATAGSSEAELVHLLRAMAMLKVLFVAAAAGAIWWRLTAPISAVRLGGYVVAAASMAAGPGLIWFLSHIGAASILLHGGVAASVVLLWFDPAAGPLLEGAIARRRARLRTGW